MAENGITFTFEEFDNFDKPENENEIKLDIDALVLDKEEEKEKLPPIKEETPAEEVIAVDPFKGKTSNEILNVAKRLLGVETIVKTNENGEDVEVSLEDANLTLEDVMELSEDKKKQELVDLKLNSVSTKNLNDNQKAIIDIVAKGGDISSLVALHEAYVDPLSKLDLDNEKDQIEVIYLHGKSDGKSDEDIELIIEGAKARGILKEKSEASMTALNKAVENATVSEQKKANEKIKELEDMRKEFKKNLKENIKKDFAELNDVSTSKLVDFASKKKEDGKYEMDLAYMKMRSDAQLATKLALFLYDTEEYNKVITKNISVKEAIKTEQKLRLGRLTSGGSSAATKTEENKGIIIDF